MLYLIAALRFWAPCLNPIRLRLELQAQTEQNGELERDLAEQSEINVSAAHAKIMEEVTKRETVSILAARRK